MNWLDRIFHQHCWHEDIPNVVRRAPLPQCKEGGARTVYTMHCCQWPAVEEF